MNANGNRAAKKAGKGGGTELKCWAYAGVVLMAGLSAVLNGYANALHSISPAAGWGMGLAVPAIILIIARVAGIRYRMGQRRNAYIGVGIGVGLLALSVYHCAISIALITGSSLWLALPMAVAVDAGLVYCEAQTVLD